MSWLLSGTFFLILYLLLLAIERGLQRRVLVRTLRKRIERICAFLSTY